MTLTEKIKQRYEANQRATFALLDSEWEARELSGENLILILRGEHWQTTKPSLRDLDQNRDCLLHNISQGLKK